MFCSCANVDSNVSCVANIRIPDIIINRIFLLIFLFQTMPLHLKYDSYSTIKIDLILCILNSNTYLKNKKKVVLLDQQVAVKIIVADKFGLTTGGLTIVAVVSSVSVCGLPTTGKPPGMETSASVFEKNVENFVVTDILIELGSICVVEPSAKPPPELVPAFASNVASTVPPLDILVVAVLVAPTAKAP